MKLELGNFYVKDICFGDQTSLKDGLLTVNKEEALAVIKEDEHITEAELYIVSPGDQVRLVPVKEAIESRYRVGGGPVFPGVTGEFDAGRKRNYLCTEGYERFWWWENTTAVFRMG